MSQSDPVEFCGEVKHETDYAYLITDGVNDFWIPKSQIREMKRVGKDGDNYEITIPEWLAMEKEII